MFLRLFLLFVSVVALETLLLVQIHAGIGLLGTVALILLTGALAAVLVKREGLRTMRTLQTQTLSGTTPSIPLVEGVLILVAAAVLLTPGLMTDACGFALLIPSVRRRAAVLAIARFKASMAKKAQDLRDRVATASGVRQPEVIDVEFERVPK